MNHYPVLLLCLLYGCLASEDNGTTSTIEEYTTEITTTISREELDSATLVPNERSADIYENDSDYHQNDSEDPSFTTIGPNEVFESTNMPRSLRSADSNNNNQTAGLKTYRGKK